MRIPFGDVDTAMCLWTRSQGCYIHIRRGLRSCLSKRGGKFEGLDCEISSEYGSHAFFYLCSSNFINSHLLAGDRRCMLLCSVMNLTKHLEHTLESTAYAGDYINVFQSNFGSGIQSDIEELIKKRTQIAGIVHDRNLHVVMAIAIKTIIDHLSKDGKIMVAGNGGSASQSQHFCSELMGRYKQRRSPIQAISLCSDISLVTCLANDYGYERIFSKQIEGLGEKDDIFVAFTTSGKSRNILEALCECKARSICSIVFTGATTDSVNRLADIVIPVPVEDTAIVQEVHMQLIHIICETLERNYQKDCDSAWKYVLELGKADNNNCLILDRDGVINHVKANGYIKTPSEFVLRDDFKSCIKELSETFHYIFVVTNQKGVGKGLMTMPELQTIHEKMLNEISLLGGRIDKVYVSTSADNNDADNKPNIGMADSIKKDYPDVEFSKTVIVGDSASDFLFADKLNSKFVYVRTR